MPQRIRVILQYGLSLAFATALFYYLYKDENFSSLLEVFEQANPFWIGLSLLAAVLSHLSRAARWRLALKPLGATPRLFTTFCALMSGYFANLFVPRLGEVIRSGMLAKTDGVPASQSFGAVVAERAVDLIMLFLLVVVTLWVEFEKVGEFVATQAEASLMPLIGKLELIALLLGFALLGVASLYLLWKYRDQFGILQKIWAVLEGVQQGLLSIRKLHWTGQALYILHTLHIWLMYYLMSYLLFFSTEATESLSPLCGLTVLMMGSIGMALPSPGGVGTYHIFVSATFLAYGLSETVGKEFAFLMHSTQTIGIIVLGGICFLTSLAMGKKK